MNQFHYVNLEDVGQIFCDRVSDDEKKLSWPFLPVLEFFKVVHGICQVVIRIFRYIWKLCLFNHAHVLLHRGCP